MENSPTINYAGETVPISNDLIAKCQAHVSGLSSKNKYKFEELFFPVKNEYHRNTSIWLSIYNNWDKDEYKEAEKPESEQRSKNEVKGLYIFYENHKAIYVGISRKILRRLKNHFRGTTHNEASLVYLMLRDKHDKKHKLYKGNRSDLKLFEDEREMVQTEMLANWKIAIIPIEDNYEMYLTELLIACELKTKWNTFETH
ncbi:GIY-YIG nuclease family protein [Fulvivirga sp. 29W222]|uniref:GIY-YIG nuclease family protein n=1 Tax=Fulvivirga marina TaxID=2494733 RepID=A0A937KFP0_9BACT|nr:GIY-YIG nuclease family protein [Fulvivirga marina]MBL6448383.1 GIY-YIG nuclease family protein [Fulvivirga marina]